LQNPGALKLFFLLVVIQFLHSLEEFATRLYDRFPIVTGRIHEIITIFPVVNMSPVTFAAFNAIIILFLVTLGRGLYKRKKWAWKIARIVAYIEIVNGLAHIWAAFYSMGYWPGCISAVGLLVVGILLVRSISSDKLTIEDGT
jgi:hypothetical protein